MKNNNLSKRVLIGGLTGIAYLAFGGCGKNQPTQVVEATPSPTPDYFAELPALAWDKTNSAISLVTGDFDGDNDIDLIVGVQARKSPYNVQLYQYDNDGKGNFSLRER